MSNEFSDLKFFKKIIKGNEWETTRHVVREIITFLL